MTTANNTDCKPSLRPPIAGTTIVHQQGHRAMLSGSEVNTVSRLRITTFAQQSPACLVDGCNVFKSRADYLGANLGHSFVLLSSVFIAAVYDTSNANLVYKTAAFIAPGFNPFGSPKHEQTLLCPVM